MFLAALEREVSQAGREREGSRGRVRSLAAPSRIGHGFLGTCESRRKAVFHFGAIYLMIRMKNRPGKK